MKALDRKWKSEKVMIYFDFLILSILQIPMKHGNVKSIFHRAQLIVKYPHPRTWTLDYDDLKIFQTG